MQNEMIRKYAKRQQVLLWEIADRLGIADSNFSRVLRKELPEEERDKIMNIIDDIRKSRKEGVNA